MTNLSRREFFTGWRELLSSRLEKVRQSSVPGEKRQPQPFLRPPGALPGKKFLELCQQCPDCLVACPKEAIRFLGHEFGKLAGTPAVIPRDSPCWLCKDLPCIAACTTGALQPVEVAEVKMGKARINYGACYVSTGQPCDYCVMRCPLKPSAVRWGNQNLPEIDVDACTGCGVCDYLCPANAIEIAPASWFDW